MAAIGARTSRVLIGTSVLVVPYRNPLVLAKQLSTIDRVSHGRVVLGIGVGWMREEFDALGIDDLWEERGAVTDEFMAVCIDLWTQQGPSSFEGRWVRYDERRRAAATRAATAHPDLGGRQDAGPPCGGSRGTEVGITASGRRRAELRAELAAVGAAMETRRTRPWRGRRVDAVGLPRGRPAGLT